MQTQREPKGEHVTYLIPPVSLTFTIYQQHRNRCLIDAEAYSGMHRFVHRQIEAFYDTFGEIPVMIGSSMLSWTLWLVQFEAERRDPTQRKRTAGLSHFPDWPSPQTLSRGLTEIEF